MSNEELFARIRAGEQEMVAVLWEQVENLVKWKAKRIMTALELRGDKCGIEFDDLVQCGYPALLEAMESYNQEAGSFSNWFMFYLRKAFSDATGYRTKQGQEEPLNNALSLDKPLSDDPEAATMGEMIPDAEAAATMERIEEKLWREQLREALETVLQEIPEEQSDILRHRYYAGESLRETGESAGMELEQVRKLENMGLRTLRRLPGIERIWKFYISD